MCCYCVRRAKQEGEKVIPKKYTLEDAKLIFEKAGYRLISKEYKNSKSKLEYVCPNHQDIVQSIRLNDIQSGHGCRFCGEESSTNNLRAMALNQRLSPSYVRKFVEQRGFTLLNEYQKASTRLKILCPKHNSIVQSVRYADFKVSIHGCKFCAVEARRTPFDDVKTEFTARGYVLLSPESDYKNSNSKLKYKCLKHPKIEQEIAMDSIMGGHGCPLCGVDKISGENHYKFNPSVSDEDRVSDRRYDKGAYKWRTTVYKRDEYTCQVCRDGGTGNLNAHHIDGFNWCVEKRYDVNNGITLCKECHKDFHRKYGTDNNTKEQFEEWLKLKKIT